MLQACKNQVTTLSGFKTDPSKSIAKYLEFRFDESRRITVDAEVTTADATGWDVHSSSNEVYTCLDNVCFCVWSKASCF